MSNQVREYKINEWVLKLRQPENQENSSVVVLLHGWTGDENSMWAFDSQLPISSLVIALRGPFSVDQKESGGYSWVDQPIDFWPTYQDFLPAVYKFRFLVDELKSDFSWANFDKISIVGFSQGAAMAISITLEFPTLVRRLAVLAGFLPDQINKKIPDGYSLDVFIGHGEKDQIVPIRKAQEVKKYFETDKNNVTYCSAAVEHRLGRECAIGLRDFLMK